MTKGPIYPFRLKDFKGRWLKVAPSHVRSSTLYFFCPELKDTNFDLLKYVEGRWQTLYVDNKQVSNDNESAELCYIPNYVLTSRSSVSGGEPSGWIVRAEDGVVFWMNSAKAKSNAKRDIGNNGQVRVDHHHNERNLRSRGLLGEGFFAKCIQTQKVTSRN